MYIQSRAEAERVVPTPWNVDGSPGGQDIFRDHPGFPRPGHAGDPHVLIARYEREQESGLVRVEKLDLGGLAKGEFDVFRDIESDVFDLVVSRK